MLFVKTTKRREAGVDGDPSPVVVNLSLVRAIEPHYSNRGTVLWFGNGHSLIVEDRFEVLATLLTYLSAHDHTKG